MTNLSTILTVLILAGPVSAEAECPLKLRLIESHYPLEISAEGDLKSWQVQPVLENTGAEPFLFLPPGWASVQGLRMPLVWWEVEGEGHEWPEVPPVKGSCWNMYAVTEKSFYSLEAGRAYNFWRSMPSFSLEDPGEYRARLRFLYQPDAEWKGTPYEPHDEKALALSRSRPACDLSSDWITVVVPEDREASIGNWDLPCVVCFRPEPTETVWETSGRGE